jgi:hypothetical protein
LVKKGRRADWIVIRKVERKMNCFKQKKFKNFLSLIFLRKNSFYFSLIFFLTFLWG